ncbi:MAG: alpha/beta fold hydrolase, partial [Chloroflexota bacterium]
MVDTTRIDSQIQNPHLDGDSFYWPGSNGTGILLIHGFRATSAEVRLLAQRLHLADYTVAGPLLNGHGTNVDHMIQSTHQDWYQSALDSYLMIRDRCSKVIVGGESMGGLLALQLASEFPEIAAVLAYAPALEVTSPLRFALPFAALLSRVIKQITLPEGPPSVVDDRWQGYYAYPARSASELYSLIKLVRSELPKIKQPLLVVQGRKDQLVTTSSANYLMESVGSKVKELVWFDHSEHCVLLDQELESVIETTL